MARTVRIAAMADPHYGKTATESLRSVFREISEAADVLVLCGDLTDYGLPEEAETALAELRVASIPIIGVLGNHDYQSGREKEVRDIFERGGVKILDGDSIEVSGVGFAGTKGFGGGFGAHTLEPWGETMIKAFVQEALDEALKLESALSRLRTEHRIAVLHYAPIAATVAGEPEQIFPYLGSSRLEDPINRHRCDAVFHGHAHRGTHDGATQTGIPVYNVSLSLMRRNFPQEPPYRLIKISLE
ncbi:MAG TPA: metallophosphoesterase [Planctomycetaceae bacterium]|jgi:Icc-related predicted phosphoesterase